MKVEIIGVPMDLGANRRGTDMGPSAIRYAGLVQTLLQMGLDVTDSGNINVPVAESIKAAKAGLIFLNEIAGACKKLGDMVCAALRRGNFPLVLGGDHSIAMGTLSGISKSTHNMGLIWFDAHGDFNTFETSKSGNIHGMSLAAATGRGNKKLTLLGGVSPWIREEKTVLIGVRSLDDQEKNLLKESGIKVYSIKKIDEMGIAGVINEALSIAGRDVDGIHVSFDMDVVDPATAPGVGTPVPGGLSYREAHLALEKIAESKLLKSLEICEVNPIEDTRGRTAGLAVELIASALGKSIFD
ncbi:MAG: arginase [Bacillota bacterium]